MPSLAVIKAPQCGQRAPRPTELTRTPAAESNREENVSHLEDNQFHQEEGRGLTPRGTSDIEDKPGLREIIIALHADYSEFSALSLNILC